MRTLMSPRRRIPSGSTFFEPPNKRQAIAFLMSAGRGDGSAATRQHLALPSCQLTSIPEDTRRDTAGEPLVKVLAPSHGTKLLLLLGGKVATAATSAVRVELEAEHAEVRGAQGDGGITLRLAGLEGRVDARGDDASAGDDFAREVADSSSKVSGLRRLHEEARKELTGRR